MVDQFLLGRRVEEPSELLRGRLERARFGVCEEVSHQVTDPGQGADRVTAHGVPHRALHCDPRRDPMTDRD